MREMVWRAFFGRVIHNLGRKGAAGGAVVASVVDIGATHSQPSSPAHCRESEPFGPRFSFPFRAVPPSRVAAPMPRGHGPGCPCPHCFIQSALHVAWRGRCLGSVQGIACDRFPWGPGWRCRGNGGPEWSSGALGCAMPFGCKFQIPSNFLRSGNNHEF